MAIEGVGFDSKETVQEFIDKIKSETTRLQEEIGNLEDLDPHAHDSLVLAINEINQNVENITSLIPSGTTSTNPLVNSDTVAPALADVTIENFKTDRKSVV